MDGLFLYVCVYTGCLPVGQLWSSGYLRLFGSSMLDKGGATHTNTVLNRNIWENALICFIAATH